MRSPSASTSRDRMHDHVEDQLLEFHDLGADPIPRLPPSIRVEFGVARGSNHDLHAVTLRRSIEYAPDATGMIRCGDYYDSRKFVSSAPFRQDVAFGCSSIDAIGNLLDRADAQRSRQPG